MAAVASPAQVVEEPSPFDLTAEERIELGIADSDTTESPVSGEEAVAEGTVEDQESDDTPREQLIATMAADELRKLIEDEDTPREVRAEALNEQIKRAEQRGRTRTDEVDAHTKARQAAYGTIRAKGEAADGQLASRLRGVAKAMEEFDYDKAAELASGPELARLVEDYKDGAIANAATVHDADIRRVSSKALAAVGTLTADEDKRLEAAIYADAPKGGLTQIEVLVDLLNDRLQRAPAKPAAEAEQKAAEVDPALDRITRAKTMIDNAAPRVRGGGAVTGGPALSNELIGAMSDEEYDRRRPEILRWQSERLTGARR